MGFYKLNQIEYEILSPASFDRLFDTQKYE